MKKENYKKSNWLIYATDISTGESRYFRTYYTASKWTGVNPQQIKYLVECNKKSSKYPNIEVKLVDGSTVQWKDIDNFE